MRADAPDERDEGHERSGRIVPQRTATRGAKSRTSGSLTSATIAIGRWRAAPVNERRTRTVLLARQDGVLQLLGDAGLHDRLCRDLDRFPGSRVAALAGLAPLYDQFAHAWQHELTGPLEFFLGQPEQ